MRLALVWVIAVATTVKGSENFDPNWSNVVKTKVPPPSENVVPPAPPPAMERTASAPSEGASTQLKIPGPIVQVQIAPSAQIVIAIPTMRRWTHDNQPAPVKYLTDLIKGIDDGMNEEERRKVHFLVYNVDREPEKHTEVKDLQVLYGDRVEVLVKASKSKGSDATKDEKVTLQYTDGISREVSRQTADWISGETRDATNLLFDARKKAPYVMFLEDDVKPTAGVISKVNKYIEELKNAKLDDWFMIDLYTPRISWGRNPLHVNYLERYDYECCTQAMLFRSDRLLDLLLYETMHPNSPIDDNIRDFSREDYATRGVYALVPNGFEHLGKYSSNPEKSSENVEHQSINFVP